MALFGIRCMYEFKLRKHWQEQTMTIDTAFKTNYEAGMNTSDVEKNQRSS